MSARSAAGLRGVKRSELVSRRRQHSTTRLRNEAVGAVIDLCVEGCRHERGRGDGGELRRAQDHLKGAMIQFENTSSAVHLARQEITSIVTSASTKRRGGRAGDGDRVQRVPTTFAKGPRRTVIGSRTGPDRARIEWVKGRRSSNADIRDNTGCGYHRIRHSNFRFRPSAFRLQP